MKHSLAIALVLALIATSAHARIGETREEITLRYGEGKKDDAPRIPGTERFNYSKNGFDIEVMFAAGKSVMEVFHRKDKEITDDDIKGLLKVTAASQSWTFNKKNNQWMRRDRKVRAFRQPGHSDYFFIQDTAAVKNTDTAGEGKFEGF